jgi:hypothetical protein
MHVQPGFEQDQKSPVATTGWQGRLAAATSREGVVDVARDFMALVGPEEIAGMPADCRPAKLVDGDDVASYAVTLARRSCDPDCFGDHNLQRIAAFFADALGRLSQFAPAPAAATE